MKKVVLFAVMVALCASGAWAEGGSVTILGSYTDPITGQSTQFVNAKSNDAIRGNQTVIYAMTTDPVLVTAPNGKKRWESKTTMVAHDSASSNGIVNGFFIGGFAGLAQGAGIVGAGALIRPDSGATQVNQGGNAQQSQGQRMKQQQQQNQNQVQVQSQNQTALGGAGGAGGSATITNTGGIGNVKTISNDANGNGTILGGNIF